MTIAVLGAIACVCAILFYYRLVTDITLNKNAKVAASLLIVPAIASLCYGTYLALINW